ncbi:MAG: R3H domain-containing nucleic acid-binding protein [Minisyncoccia bacterium]
MNLKESVQKLFSLMGFEGAEITVDDEHKKVLIMIDNELIRSNMAVVLPAVEHLINLITHKENLPLYIVDINYYRRERERLIIELAKAAAKKAMVTKSEVSLPAMNAYERRLVHVEISTHPDLKTESVGLGKDRHIVIQLIPS